MNSWLQKLARPQYGFLGEETTVFRTVDLTRAEEVLRIGFKDNQFFATSEDRAVFYANFTAEQYPGAIFECVIDTSRSHADMNDATSEQQQESYEGIRSAADEVYNYLTRDGIGDIEIYEIEHFIGAQAGSDIGGYYDGEQEASFWLFVSERTGLSPAEVSNIVPPGSYGGFFMLDNRGIFGVDADLPSGQLQHRYFVPPRNIKAVYLHTSLFVDLGWKWNSYNSGIPVDGIGDYVSIIPAQMEELHQEAENQLNRAAPDSELSDQLHDLVEEFEENMSHYEDQHGSMTISGNVYRKLYGNQPLVEEDFNSNHGFVRFELPADRVRALYAIRKGAAK